MLINNYLCTIVILVRFFKCHFLVLKKKKYFKKDQNFFLTKNPAKIFFTPTKKNSNSKITSDEAGSSRDINLCLNNPSPMFCIMYIFVNALFIPLAALPWSNSFLFHLYIWSWWYAVLDTLHSSLSLILSINTKSEIYKEEGNYHF